MLRMQGRQEQLKCRVDDFHNHGSSFEYTERTTKTRTGENDAPKAKQKYDNKIFCSDGSERDPYLALKTYISHRSACLQEFYLQPNDNPKDNMWYKRPALKGNGLGNIMKRMAQQAGIENERLFTNTSGCKTAVQSLWSHFDPMEIPDLTTHANPSSIQSYSCNSLQTQQQIYHRLTGCSSTTAHNNMTTSVNLSKESQQTLSNIFNLSSLNSCQININFQK